MKKQIILLISVFVMFIGISFAEDRVEPYDPGETLNPSCIPTDANCNVDLSGIGKFVDGSNSSDGVYTIGNIGIGTISPSKKLDIAGDINFSGNLYKNGTLVDLGDEESTNLWTENSGNIFYNNNVGIGISLPSTKLHVEGVGRFDSGIEVDGRNMINAFGSVHNAQYNTDSHYGFYNVINDSGSKGAYFGFGNGGSEVSLALVDATILNINAGTTLNISATTETNISGDTNIGGDTTITGDTNIGGSTTTNNLDVTNITTLKDLSVTNNVDIGGDTTILGDTTTNNLDVTNITTLKDLSVTNNVDIGGDTTITGDTNIGGSTTTTNLDVTNITTLKDLSVINNATINNISIGGDITNNEGDIIINESTHTSISDNNTSYGIFQSKRDDGLRGFYIGGGNGSSTVNLNLDNANRLDIIGGNLLVEGVDGGNGTVTAQHYLYNSDINLKKDISRLENYRDILKIDAVRFNWKEDGKADVGIIAQEVQKYFPEFVVKSGGNLTVDYPKLSVPMLNLLQDQEERLDKQEKEIQELREMIKKLQK